MNSSYGSVVGEMLQEEIEEDSKGGMAERFGPKKSNCNYRHTHCDFILNSEFDRKVTFMLLSYKDYNNS